MSQSFVIQATKGTFPAHTGSFEDSRLQAPHRSWSHQVNTQNRENRELLTCSCADSRLWTWTTILILALLWISREKSCPRSTWVILWLNEVGGTVYLRTFVIRLQVPAVCSISMAEEDYGRRGPAEDEFTLWSQVLNELERNMGMPSTALRFQAD